MPRDIGLESGSVRRCVLQAVKQALRAADPGVIIRERVRLEEDDLIVDSLNFDLSRFKRILILGGGKASGCMALEIERILAKRITAGVVNIPEFLKPKPRSARILFNAAAHPVPSEDGVKGVEMMLELVGHPTDQDLVICVISGGGSALLPLPIKGVRLRDKQKVTQLLLRSGADINELNTLRKHLSAIKGGRLAEKLYPATILSLIISDVVGDRVGVIASGPTAPDDTTYHDAKNVLEKYNLWNKTPARCKRVIEDGIAGRLAETPKPDSEFFNRSYNIIIGSNKHSCVEAAEELRKSGYETLILSTRIQGEAREVGGLFASILSDMCGNRLPLSPPAAIVAGGETTVKVEGYGKGGRNQELVLSAAMKIRGLQEVAIASVGTDGVDGPTDAAGAIADGHTIDRASKLGLDANASLRNNDSYNFFHRLGDLIITGATGTNVNDIIIGASARNSTVPSSEMKSAQRAGQ